MCEMMLDWRSTRRIMLTPSESEIIISNTAPVMSRIYELQIGLEFQRAIGAKSEYEGMFRSCSKGHHTYLDHVDEVITLELMTSLHSMTSRDYAPTLPKLSWTTFLTAFFSIFPILPPDQIFCRHYIFLSIDHR